MLFNSNDFLCFFAVFFPAYFLLRKNLLLRNLLVVLGSYIFYSWWDPRFTILLLGTSLLDFCVGWLLDVANTSRTRRMLLITSVVINLTILGAFKYFNFFRESFGNLVQTFGLSAQWKAWDILLPVGISFYTFQSMSYIIDVYRREMRASRDLISFLAYVSFFPQLVAGPIERGINLLPQFSRHLTITREAVELGIWLIIWGLFKKVVIADNLAPLVELVYDHGAGSGLIVVLGTVAFGLQIYCDFSGYSDIACGLAKLLGFELMLNFNLPYLATSLRDFWRKWHISLSTWLRDYLYISLGGNRKGESRARLNLAITMLLGGLWHGAAANFVLWGLWHGLGLIAYHHWDKVRTRRNWLLPSPVAWLITQCFVFYGWMLFRAGSLDQVLDFTRFMTTDFSLPSWWPTYAWNLLILSSPLIAMELWQRKSGNLKIMMELSLWSRSAFQAVLLVLIITFWRAEASPFIYFQF